MRTAGFPFSRSISGSPTVTRAGIDPLTGDERSLYDFGPGIRERAQLIIGYGLCLRPLIQSFPVVGGKLGGAVAACTRRQEVPDGVPLSAIRQALETSDDP